MAAQSDEIQNDLPDEALLDAIVQISFTTMAVLSRIGAENDLSLTQLRVLAILRDRTRVRVTVLAGHLGLEKSTMSGLVDRAVRRGLLERAPSAEDRRAVDILLTEQGQELAARLAVRVAEGLAPLIRHLAAADERALRDLLARLLGGVA